MARPVAEVPLSLVVLALARNCEPHLPRFAGFIDLLQSQGYAVQAIVGEDGSTDGTRRALTELSQKRPITVEDTSFIQRFGGRLNRLAQGRERLRIIARALEPRPDIVAVLDVDDVIEAPISAAALKSELVGLRDDPRTFGASATSDPHYYDVLAFADEELDPADLEARIADAKHNPLTYYGFLARNIYDVQDRIAHTKRDAISAFNGLAFYKAAPYFESSYLGTGTGRLSEHVVLNRGIAARTGARMRISSTIVMKTPDDHRRRGVVGFWWYRARKYAGRLLKRATRK